MDHAKAYGCSWLRPGISRLAETTELGTDGIGTAFTLGITSDHFVIAVLLVIYVDDCCFFRC